jgi:SAM-dependent methyltransferase
MLRKLLASVRGINKHAPIAHAQLNDYEARKQSEIANFKDDINVHDLPEIFHYWSNKYLRPAEESLGFSSPNDFFCKWTARHCGQHPQRPVRAVSIGAGNCDLETDIAAYCRQQGHDNLRIECLDLNPHMLQRGREHARKHNVVDMIVPLEGDFNHWQPVGNYDIVIANQSLHHVVELEHLFDTIKSHLAADGIFITSDMIGRNGHMRWPEALAVVNRFWAELDDRYKYNHFWKRIDHEFINHDCSEGCFEGIRAQDILPLLLERFHFETFIGFANVIDPFIDRAYGHNFDINNPDDLAFIDRVHAEDQRLLLEGEIKPTHMVACMQKAPVTERHLPGLSARDAVRECALVEPA